MATIAPVNTLAATNVSTKTNVPMTAHAPTIKTIPLIPISNTEFATWVTKQSTSLRNWLEINKFKGEPFTFCTVADAEGKLKEVIVGIAAIPDLYCLAHLPMVLPEGHYHVEDATLLLNNIPVELGWALSAYQFTRYKKAKRAPASLARRAEVDKVALHELISATYLVRDLVNTPAEDMNPVTLAAAATTLAEKFNATVNIIVGKNLLTENYPTVHAVGRASTHEPRLIDLRWGNSNDKKITLVGKGVCFDSGGLDLKSADGMAGMEKDMAGAAHALALAQLIMAANLPVRLRVLIPAVENSVSANAYRPGDIIKTRHGMTVEIGNTDAEGRLILCDALAEAATEAPALLINFATLTGAARVAVGTEIAAFFTDHNKVAIKLQESAELTHDPIWRLPLYTNYRSLLNSDTADINNTAQGRYGGAITAALFLKEFVPATIPWVHFDIMAANVTESPGRPKGGEAMGLRACFDYIKNDVK